PWAVDRSSLRFLDQAPCDRFARTEGHDLLLTERVGGRGRPCFAHERDLARIARQPVEVRTPFRCERLQPIEPTRLLERFGIELERRMRGEDACAAAGIFLRMSCMRRAVGAEEEARIVARGCLDERFTIPLPLQDRQAVVMRTNAAL